MMKLAFVFPGQGSQSVGMMDGFAAHPVVRATFAEASRRARRRTCGRWSTEGPAEALNLTVNTQPVMLTAGVAVWRAWRAAGGAEPAVVAGHSLGEYTALVAAGALAFRDAVPLVRFRAQAMQEAVPAGRGRDGGDHRAATTTRVAAACAEAAQGEVVEPVNFNAPGQVVIAGHKERRRARDRGWPRRRAPSAACCCRCRAPFHSSLLKPAAERLARGSPSVAFARRAIPVVHNVDVAEHRDARRIRDALARQAASPVRWVETVRAMADARRHARRRMRAGQGARRARRKRIDETLEALRAQRRATRSTQRSRRCKAD